VPPVSVTLDAALIHWGAGVTVDAPVEAVPPKVLLALPEATTPLGNMSVSGAVSRAGVAPALLKVMVRTEAPPALIVAVRLKEL